MQTFIVDSSKAILIALSLMLGYQFALTQYNASQFVFYAPRIDFVSANREGLFSLIGYFSMQIVGIGLGRLLYEEMLDTSHLKQLKSGKTIDLKDKWEKQEDITRQERLLVARMIACEILLILAYRTSKDVFGKPSRRLCNLPYMLYNTALINSFTCYLLLIDRLLVKRYPNLVDNAINYG